MKLIIILLTIFPLFSFCQNVENSIVGKWSGVYHPKVGRKTNLPDSVKIKQNVAPSDTPRLTYTFYQNHTGIRMSVNNSEPAENRRQYKFRYKLLPGSIIEFIDNGEKTLSFFQIHNDTLHFHTYPVSKRWGEFYPVFYSITFYKIN